MGNAILRCLRILEGYNKSKGPLLLLAIGQADNWIEIDYIIEEMEICNLENILKQFYRLNP